MFFRGYRLIVYTAIPFLWIFFSQGVEALASYPIENKDQIIEYFLDTVFKNSFCECQGNDGCTRGCRCEGKKPSRRSTDNCAKHVTGAMMTVIHSFLFTHCNSIDGGASQNAVDYDQCVDSFQEDVKNGNISICRHGFKFSSAFCLLNLDGQSFDLYDSISDKGIRRKCKNWDRYNQSLLNVNASAYYGDMTIVPVFKKVPFEKITSKKNGKFQVDPAKIPVGSIVIAESDLNNSNGHVEIKTDRNECGEDKTQACFCSDFCRERLIYDKPVLAVFEWNPKFIRYMWDTVFWWKFPF